MLIPSLPRSEIVIPPSLIEEPVRCRSFHFLEAEPRSYTPSVEGIKLALRVTV